MGRGPRPLPPGEVELRMAYLEPLLTYLAEQHYIASAVADAACEQAAERGEVTLRSGHVYITKLRKRQSQIPPWLVAGCCAVIGKSVRAVMGAAWVERFGDDGRGGTERAPVGLLRMQKCWYAGNSRAQAQVNVGSSVAGADAA